MATKRTTRERRPQVTLPRIGTVILPPPEHLAFYAVLVALGVLEIVEWPIACIVGIGHLLASQHHFPSLRGAGEAAEAA
ncbi:hypothetical protein [Nonomuraea jiangxiensis]|uniref:Uncharacterized protein n=1 Tax=Nonomuraea jiangxiensis TaxID=633440 RepID=A0A1G8IBJ0_9ACTN|nr:hypothetical protein [Nonomuraea jiangxiensis]SDI16141.1 hypothetical protein SAMN05421869_104435 [Nonomuraea jiangxiensis]